MFALYNFVVHCHIS